MSDINRIFNLILNAKDGVSSTLKNVRDNLSKTEKNINTLSIGFKTIAGIAIVQQFGSFTKALIDANDNLNDLSDKTGVSVEQLSLLSEVAKLGGTDIESLSSSFVKMTQTALNTPKAFEDLGIAVLDSNGNLKDSNILFEEVADKIKSIDSPAQQSAAAISIFGKKGAELLPTLKQGAEALKQFREEQELFGAKTSTELAQTTGQFNDNIQRLGLIAQGASNSLQAGILPGVNLVIEAFIEFRKQSIEASEGLDKSLNDLGTSNTGFDSVIKAIGFIGDALQGLKNIGVVVFEGLKSFIRIFTLAAVGSYEELKTLFTEGWDAYEAQTKLTSESISNEFKKIGLVADKEFTEARFSDVLNKTFEKTKQASKTTQEEIKKTSKLSTEQSNVVITAYTKQIEAITNTTDKAINESKKALADKQAVAAEFEALAKRLNALTPPGGSLQNRLDQVNRDAAANNKLAARDDQIRATREQADADARIGALQARVDAERKAAEEKGTLSAKSSLDDAQAALDREQRYQAEKRAKNEIAAIDAERQAQQLPELQKMETRNAVELELLNIRQTIKKNQEDGTTNELEIQRLKDVGKVLEENKNKATGVFSSFNLAQYSQQLKALSAEATQIDVDIKKKLADEAIQNQVNKIQELKDALQNIEFNLDDASIAESRDKLIKALDEGLKNTEFIVPVKPLLQDPAGSTTQSTPAFADGGYVSGAGTGRSDSILARLSNGEFVIPAHITRQPGMLQMLENLRRGAISPTMKLPAFADGGLVGGATKSNNVSWSIDLKTNNGNIKLSPNTSQNDLDRWAMKALMRK